MLTAKEAAKRVKKELKEKYPLTAFSVRSDFNSIRIAWVEGADFDGVMAICNYYRGSVRNPIYDFSEERKVTIDGVEVDSMVDYISLDRTISRETQLEVTLAVLSEFGYGMEYVRQDTNWVWVSYDLPVYVQANNEISDRIRSTNFNEVKHA